MLGQGSFGVVYKGKWRSMTVAVKALMFMDAGAAKRVRQRAITEAAINTLLSHDNIVNTYAYDLRPVCYGAAERGVAAGTFTCTYTRCTYTCSLLALLALKPGSIVAGRHPASNPLVSQTAYGIACIYVAM